MEQVERLHACSSDGTSFILYLLGIELAGGTIPFKNCSRFKNERIKLVLFTHSAF